MVTLQNAMRDDKGLIVVYHISDKVFMRLSPIDAREHVERKIGIVDWVKLVSEDGKKAVITDSDNAEELIIKGYRIVAQAQMQPTVPGGHNVVLVDVQPRASKTNAVETEKAVTPVVPVPPAAPTPVITPPADKATGKK